MISSRYVPPAVLIRIEEICYFFDGKISGISIDFLGIFEYNKIDVVADFPVTTESTSAGQLPFSKAFAIGADISSVKVRGLFVFLRFLLTFSNKLLIILVAIMLSRGVLGVGCGKSFDFTFST